MDNLELFPLSLLRIWLSIRIRVQMPDFLQMLESNFATVRQAVQKHVFGRRKLFGSQYKISQDTEQNLNANLRCSDL